MKNYVERMVVELNELSDRVEKLTKFFHTETFMGLPSKKRELMERQFKAMVEYKEVLAERLEIEKSEE